MTNFRSAAQNMARLKAISNQLGLDELPPSQRVEWYTRFEAERLAASSRARDMIGAYA